MSHQYNVNLKWNAERVGEVSSPELNTKIEVATPPQFLKGVEGIWSPEHFYTAAVNSCFMTTFLAIAENFRLEFKEFNCNAVGILDQVDGKYLMTEVVLNPTLVITKEEDKEKALRVLDKSEKACLISNSITSKVSLNPTVIL
ncbi:MAG: osmotically inducible protein OsmC [Sphingobacteriaceae bacterium]|nr:osmotically inducible protein OsmC [Sphingobacteriaceae bacterium]